MENVFKPLEEQLKEIKKEFKLPKLEEDILKNLLLQKPNERVLNGMRKAIRAEDKKT